MRDFLTYDISPVTVKPWDPLYPEVFSRVCELLAVHFPGKQYVHFGSTSVPGLRGKGVIDLFMITKPEEYKRCLATLESVGFQYPTFAPQPLPAHRPWRIAAIRHGDSIYKIHVHLTWQESPDHRNALRFNVALCRDPDLREAYMKAKEDAVAKGFTGLTEYNQQKDSFLQEFLRDGQDASTR